MKEKILQMVDAYWKFDEAQQPMSSWHDKQDLLKALEELLQPAVIKSVCPLCKGSGQIPRLSGEKIVCYKCNGSGQTVL